MTKWMWIVAGPNGAGKTTVTTEILANLGVANLKKLNADERTLELRSQHPEKSQLELNLLAAQQIDAEVLKKIRSGRILFCRNRFVIPQIPRSLN